MPSPWAVDSTFEGHELAWCAEQVLDDSLGQGLDTVISHALDEAIDDAPSGRATKRNSRTTKRRSRTRNHTLLEVDVDLAGRRPSDERVRASRGTQPSSGWHPDEDPLFDLVNTVQLSRCHTRK